MNYCFIHTDPSQKARQQEISEFLEDLRELGIGEQPVAPNAVKPHPITANDNEKPTEEISPAMCKLSHEWVPLELSFGIPLFDEEANRSVSDKVATTDYRYSRVSILVTFRLFPIICLLKVVLKILKKSTVSLH